MYHYFEPKRAAQGLPPDGERRIAAWLKDVLPRGTHLLAHVKGDVVGHVMLIPLDDRTVELANFVDLHWRDRGLGTALNRAAIDAARHGNWDRVWLCVDPSNRAAIRSYTRAGFKPVPGLSWAPEIEMSIDLTPPDMSSPDDAIVETGIRHT